MIRECSVHGYFSDEPLCPACNDEGKFIMRTGERNSMARRLALILRHAPEKFDLEMDINGWIDVKDIIRQFKKRDEKGTTGSGPTTSGQSPRPTPREGTRSAAT